MQGEKLLEIVIDALEDMKAVEIKTLDVSEHSNVTDYMVIASGTSKRHVKSIADNVLVKIKEQGVQPIGSEGGDAAEWVLVDLGDVVVNVMMPDTRLYYDLEKLWHPMEDDNQDSLTHE